MKRELSLLDLNPQNWSFPTKIQSEEDKAQFMKIFESFCLTEFIDIVNTDPLYRINERQKIIDKIKATDKLDKCRAYIYQLKQKAEIFYLNKNSTACNIEKRWIQIRILILCIESEYRALLNTVPVQKKDCIITDLPFDLSASLWQIAYFRYKEEIENHINCLSDNYSPPNFINLVRHSDHESENIIRYSWKDISDNDHLSKGSSDGEAEFWKAYKNGNLDAIGF